MDLFDAIRAGDVAAVQAVLKADPRALTRSRADGVTPLLWAAYLRQAPVLDALLALGPTQSLFECAAVGDLRGLSERLAQRPEDRDALSPDGWTALHLAAFFGWAPCVERLLALGAEVDPISATREANRPLQAAATGRHLHVCELLLSAGADPNARTAGGYTALHSAVRTGMAPLVQCLLDHGASPHIIDELGHDAAWHAEDSGHTELIHLW